MADPASFPFCNEFYVVEKSIEVVVSMKGNSTSVRIDALHDLKEDRYNTRAYIEAMSFLKSCSADDEEDVTPIPIWKAWTGLPWTVGNSADDVLTSALSFLRESCQP